MVTRAYLEKESDSSFAGVETTTFRLLVRQLYHLANGDDRKNPSAPEKEANLRPFNYDSNEEKPKKDLKCPCDKKKKSSSFFSSDFESVFA